MCTKVWSTSISVYSHVWEDSRRQRCLKCAVVESIMGATERSCGGVGLGWRDGGTFPRHHAPSAYLPGGPMSRLEESAGVGATP